MITSRDEMLHIAFYTYNVLLPRTYCIKFVFQFNLRTCTNHMQKIQKAKYLVRNTANIINNYYHILFNILKSQVTSVSLYLNQSLSIKRYAVHIIHKLAWDSYARVSGATAQPAHALRRH